MKRIKIRFASHLSILLILLLLIVSACAPRQQQKITIPEDADIGLKAVEQAGLIRQLSLPAQVTLATDGASPASVMLDWVYADENRLAIGWTVNGLNVPNNANLDDYICDPYFSKKEGIEFGKYGMLRYIRPENGDSGNLIHLTYIYYQDVASKKASKMYFTADLTLGSCGSSKPGLESGQYPRVQVTPIPMIGNYRVSFNTPVYQGITIRPDQTVTANNITARLDTIVASPSYLISKICFSIKDMKNKLGDWESVGWSATSFLQINNGDWLEGNFDYSALVDNELCTDFGFGTPILEKENKVIVKVSPSAEGLKENWEFHLQVIKVNP